jgi:hypothetical protein
MRATGERIGSISYETHLGQESGRVRLYYTTTSSVLKVLQNR